MNIPERNVTFTCRDGLSLFCRDFGPLSSEKLPVLCLPGLTRNSKDFISPAQHYGHTRHFICPDFRGRGQSDWDSDFTRYYPTTYVEDMWELLAFLEIRQVAIIGTSLGGLMAMIMASSRPEMVSGVVLNDIGPEVDAKGHSRVSAYVGRLPPVKDWTEAVWQAKEVYQIALPDLNDEEWLRFTKRQYRQEKDRIHLEYDPKIGKALREVGGVPADPWVLFEAFRELPLLVLHGAISDILSRETVDKMARRKPDMMHATIPNRGHVPLLDEPECISAMDRFFG